MATDTKNQHEPPKAHDLVKPGSTIDPKKPPGQAGQPGQDQPQIGAFVDTEEHHDPIDPKTGLRGRPESPSDRPGQRTRDNVNPNIPSAPPGEGGIVDPRSLGMPQGGVAPPPVKSVNEPRTPATKSGPNPQAAPTEWPYVGIDPEHPLNVPQSPNEPPGSDVTGGAGGSPEPETPLVLTSVTPDTAVIGPEADVALTIAGDGFDATCVVVFGDEDIPTTFVSATELTAVAPMATVAEIVDVEVSRGDDTSDVLTFEWTAVAGRRTAEKSERKPKKATPASKRLKKGKR